ncbi:MAG: allantoinase AllB [Anaerolineaceae bacterium]|nr:allantoinase AllB [Anaerolineaceae bacterium]
MSADLYLKNAQVVTEAGVFPGGVVVNAGKIVEVVTNAAEVEAGEVIDLQGKLLMPGIVDGHVHFNQPGRDHWEGYRTGTMAAAAGGVTSVLEMPLNSTPPTITKALLDHKREVVRQEAVIDYAQWGGLVDNNLDDLAGMNSEGVIGFKAFMSNSGVDFERLDDDLIYAGLLKMKELGNLVGLHAENENVTTYLGKQLRAAGRTDRASWYESRPPETELEAVERACFWAKVTGGNLQIVHVSIPEGIRAVARAKAEGTHVTAETCPHFLFFDHQDFERIGPAAKCAPPIRSRETVEALWECVKLGMVDTIGSDHSPCSWDEKAKGMDNIWNAWGGISGVQQMLPALLTAGVHQHNLPLKDLARMLSANPARLFGLYPQKGDIRPGTDADLVVVDLNKEWTLSADQLLYKNKHSAYVGCSFKGKVERTFVRGVTVYQDGEIKVQPGFGQLLRRNYPYNYQAA